jgi:hypothetical protein
MSCSTKVGHHLADRPEAIEQVEDQANRRLRLLVGVEDDLARGTARIADRHGLAEFAPARLGFPARQHPRLEDMKLGFRHRAFRPHDILPSNSRLRSSSGIRTTRMQASGLRSSGVSLTQAMRILSSSCQTA